MMRHDTKRRTRGASGGGSQRWRPRRTHKLALITLLLAFVGSVGAAIAEEAKLVRGLDGGDYEPYRSAIIERVQKALQEKGFYENGEIHGRLDEATMKAIQVFQKEHRIHASGVPSPLTRHALFGAQSETEHADRDS